MTEARKLQLLKWVLRVWGGISIPLFGLLFTGFMIRFEPLAEGQPLNWLIWNGISSNGQMSHVPPMLFVVYIVWGLFALLASREPRMYLSFLSFTAWANLAHGALMAGQAVMMMERYWSKWVTDIPWTLGFALLIFWLRPGSVDGRE
jgi:hypothetical protein